jgi:hypothetical protein
MNSALLAAGAMPPGDGDERPAPCGERKAGGQAMSLPPEPPASAYLAVADVATPSAAAFFCFGLRPAQ